MIEGGLIDRVGRASYLQHQRSIEGAKQAKIATTSGKDTLRVTKGHRERSRGLCTLGGGREGGGGGGGGRRDRRGWLRQKAE